MEVEVGGEVGRGKVEVVVCRIRKRGRRLIGDVKVEVGWRRSSENSLLVRGKEARQ
jgi:hypothetical protein